MRIEYALRSNPNSRFLSLVHTDRLEDNTIKNNAKKYVKCDLKIRTADFKHIRSCIFLNRPISLTRIC